jgi:hypothetical protein
MADDRWQRHERRGDKWDRYHPQYSGQGGGYGQSGLGLNYPGSRPPLGEQVPYRVPPSPEGGGYHHGAYAAEHYRGQSEREPGTPDRIGAGISEPYAYATPNHRGRGPRNYIRSDARIEEDLAERLMRNDYLDATDIEIIVDNGEVTLNGSVHDRQDRRLAEDIAEAVAGVRNVQNNLRLQPTDWTP